MNTEAAAFRAVYDAHHARIVRLLARMVGSQDADDVAQTVFLKVAHALPAFRGDAELSTWLYRIAVNAASDWLGSRAVRDGKLTVGLPDPGHRDGGSAVDVAIDERPTPEQALAHKNAADCLRADIGRLAEAHRDVLLLGLLGGMSDDEMAEILGITPGNARVRLHRAKAELKQIIGDRCDFYRGELACEPASRACCGAEKTEADTPSAAVP